MKKINETAAALAIHPKQELAHWYMARAGASLQAAVALRSASATHPASGEVASGCVLARKTVAGKV